MRLGEVSVAVKATGLSKYKKDLTGAEKTTDKFGNQTSKSVGKASKAIKQLGLTAGSVLSAAVIGKLVKDSIVVFKTFETATVDMGKVTSRSLDLMKAEILGMDSLLGTSSNLMAGYYQSISAGIKGTTAQLDNLTISSQTAKAAHVGQAETIKGITKLMAGYEGQIKSAASAADILFTIEKEGQTAVAELIPHIGGLAKASFDLAVSQDEMGAAFATITKTAGSTSVAATQYRMTLMGLFKPQENMLKIFKKLDVASGRALVQQEGYAGALKLVKEEAEKMGIGLGKVFESSEALMGISALGAKNWKTYSDSLVEMTKKTGAQQKAWDAWTETVQASLDKAGANLEKFQIKFMDTFGDDTKDTIDAFSDSLEYLTDNFEKFTEYAGYISKVNAALGLLISPIKLITFTIDKMGIELVSMGEGFDTWVDLLSVGFVNVEHAVKVVATNIRYSFRMMINLVKDDFAKFFDNIGTALTHIDKFAEAGADLRMFALEIKKGKKPIDDLEEVLAGFDEELAFNLRLLDKTRQHFF